MSHVFQEDELKPYANDIPLNGEGMPPLKTVDDWIRYMMTVRERFGSTVMIGKFEMKWGASALWGMDALRGLLKQWYEADCPDMQCGTDGYTCDLCTKTKAEINET